MCIAGYFAKLRAIACIQLLFSATLLWPAAEKGGLKILSITYDSGRGHFSVWDTSGNAALEYRLEGECFVDQIKVPATLSSGPVQQESHIQWEFQFAGIKKPTMVSCQIRSYSPAGKLVSSDFRTHSDFTANKTKPSLESWWTVAGVSTLLGGLYAASFYGLARFAAANRTGALYYLTGIGFGLAEAIGGAKRIIFGPLIVAQGAVNDIELSRSKYSKDAIVETNMAFFAGLIALGAFFAWDPFDWDFWIEKKKSQKTTLNLQFEPLSGSIIGRAAVHF